MDAVVFSWKKLHSKGVDQVGFSRKGYLLA